MRPRIFGCNGMGGIIGLIFPIAAIWLFERFMNKDAKDAK